MNIVERAVEALEGAARFAAVHGPSDEAVAYLEERAAELRRYRVVEGAAILGVYADTFVPGGTPTLRSEVPALLLVEREEEKP